MTISNAFKLFATEAPAHAAAWLDAARGLGDACALDPKTRDLAYLAVLATQGLVTGIPFHVLSARKNGATREEIISAVLLGLPAAGNIVTQSLPAALETFDAANAV
jgi:AhpD family alkylhydroperoxidase